MKRIFDLLISLTLFLLLLPLTVLVGIGIHIKLGAPVVFIQLRPGQNGKPFYLYKFRTMNEIRDNKGMLLPDHLRLTSFGKFIRKYSLDELPQLFNVIKGDLSLVGPRPLLMEYLPLYTKEQSKRHDVRPGMTGWAQINGRNTISWEEKFQLDVWYVNNQSFFLDIKILLLTAIKVIKKEGINQPGNVTIERFIGSNTTVKEGSG